MFQAVEETVSVGLWFQVWGCVEMGKDYYNDIFQARIARKTRIRFIFTHPCNPRHPRLK